MKRLYPFLLMVAMSFTLTLPSAAAKSGDEAPVPAAGDAARTRIAEIKRYIDLVNRHDSSLPGRISLYARVPGRKGLVNVPDSTRWPDSTQVSYNAVRDMQGRVIVFVEVPTSESGDWSNQYIHYFDSEGRTLAFERRSSFFNGCPRSARERTTSYFDSDGRLLGRDYTLTDFDGNRIDSSRCEFMYRFSYRIFRSWKELARSRGLGP